MGAKQSSSPANPAANGRTRAYSGSDLPSSTSGSNVQRTAAAGVRFHGHGASRGSGATSSTSQSGLGAGTRSVGGSRGTSTRPQSGINITNSGGAYSSPESGGSSPEEAGRERAEGGHEAPRLLVGSLPAHLSPHLFAGFKCPVCSKYVSSDEMDLHLVLCLTKPRVTYNEDVLTKDAGECAICLEDLQQGDTIARLPCLCIYHKGFRIHLKTTIIYTFFDPVLGHKGQSLSMLIMAPEIDSAPHMVLNWIKQV
ncbi:E3 ubiquitin-protein ligase znrf2 [Melanotaenia boesemani]|uniref:E3 ubiquitin-protein ligase znrf2 n=1 Tax=Melanotaenia boesemani TaxID=1250792 RepID=UPI001C04870C|nr:E3 ubiquitin-protein ligase znrf2 [Melanotaenia boesemani]